MPPLHFTECAVEDVVHPGFSTGATRSKVTSSGHTISTDVVLAGASSLGTVNVNVAVAPFAASSGDTSTCAHAAGANAHSTTTTTAINLARMIRTSP